MTDFEDRLRAAMASSVADEYPPGDLMARVRRRHRRHVIRLGAAWAAVAVAVAVVTPPARSALLAGGTPKPASPARAAAPPAQYYGCAAQTYGALAANWRQGAAHAGPLWIINAGLAPGFSFSNPDGTLKAVPLIVMLQGQSTVSVTPTAAGEPYLRFLPDLSDNGQYTLREGHPSATFAGCPAGSSIYGGGFTEFYVGVVVAGPRCISVQVRTQASRQPSRLTLRFGPCGP
ncbi:MAG: hypothetical protein ABSA53_08320 [Streptosporangiaceae bacterium]|jgi:hypothetical protein